MLNYTRAAFDKIGNDIKKLVFNFEIFTQVFMLVYFLYSLFTTSNFRIVNGILLALTIAYLIFYLQLSKEGFTKEEKKLKKRVKKAFDYIKKFFKLFTLGFTIYGIYTNVHSVDLISLILLI